MEELLKSLEERKRVVEDSIATAETEIDYLMELIKYYEARQEIEDDKKPLVVSSNAANISFNSGVKTPFVEKLPRGELKKRVIALLPDDFKSISEITDIYQVNYNSLEDYNIIRTKVATVLRNLSIDLVTTNKVRGRLYYKKK